MKSILPAIDRRRFTAFLAGFGVAGTALPKILWAEIEAAGDIGIEHIAAAEKLAGIWNEPNTDTEPKEDTESIDDKEPDPN